MSSPAEIIAARVNGSYTEPADTTATESPESRAYADAANGNANGSAASGPLRTLADSKAFPVLGGTRSVPAAAASWGPAAPGSPAASSAPKFRVSTIQEAFSLDADDQLNVARPEFIKVLTGIKTATGAGIECTTSQHTKKRTFLISGTPDQVKQAKRLVIRRLTKPVTVTFTIPAAVRARVIGAQGRHLKPIVQQNEVKVDIGHPANGDARSSSPQGLDDNNLHIDNDYDDDDDDVYAQTVDVTITGDSEGCKRARAQMLAVVAAETHDAVLRVRVDDLVRAFVPRAIAKLVEAYPQLDIAVPPRDSSSHAVIVSGERAAALEARDQIKDILALTQLRLVVERVPIPVVKHQFLPVDLVLAEHNVLIQLPGPGESDVKFVGERSNIAAAQERARRTTSQYTVEVLDMAKAHKGNLAHVRAVAAWLAKNGTFGRVADEHDVGVNPPLLAFLLDPATALIPVEIIVKNSDVEKTKAARRAIVAAVNSITLDQTRTVADIDEFLLPRAPALLDAADANYVVLGNTIVLFDGADDAAASDDFDDAPSDTLDAASAALDPLRKLQASLATAVLPVASSLQDTIAGPAGSTLRSILAAVEPDTVEVTLHANASGPSADEVYVHGLKADVATVVKDIETVLAEAEEYKATGGYKTTIEVPRFVLSRVIGKGGANLNAIRDEFGVKIDVAGEAKDSDDVTDKTLKTEITIAGIKRNADEAKNAISKLSKKLADDTLSRLRIESQYHRRIVGPSFSSILRLQEKYSVRIRFPSENNSGFGDAPKNKDEVTIRGPSKNVARAEEELKELYEFEKENGFKQTIQIPVKAIARVIGRNGETIRGIADASGIEYRFNRDRKEEEESGFSEVELTGSKKGLKEATLKIDAIIQEAENFVSVTVNVPPKFHRDLVGPSGSVMREMIHKAGGDDLSRQQYTRLLTIPDEGSESDEIVCQGDQTIVNSLVAQINEIVAEKEASVDAEYELAKDKHRLLIGPGGSIRHSLQDEFKVQIDIPRAKDSSTIVKLFGLPENIEKLKAKLDELTKDNWNESIDVPASLHGLVSDRGTFIRTLRSLYNVEVSHGNVSRQASQLSNAAIPTAPEGASGEEGASTAFTIDEIPEVKGGSGIIPWRLIGESDATAKAATLIGQQLERAEKADCAAWFYSKTPSSHFPKIVGPQGRKINQIRKITGAFITIPRINEKNSQFIYLVGTRESLEKAHESFAKLI